MEEQTVVIFPDSIQAKMTPRTLRRGFVILAIVATVIIVTLLIFGLIYSKSYFYVDVQTTPSPNAAPLPFSRAQLSPHHNIGSSANGVIFNRMNGTAVTTPQECNTDPRRVWMNGRCA